MAGLAAQSRADMLDGLLGPVVMMMGGEWTPAREKRRGPSSGSSSGKAGPPRSRRGKTKGSRFAGSKSRSTAPPERTLVLSEIDEEKQDQAFLMALSRAAHAGVKGSGVALKNVRVSSGKGAGDSEEG